MMTAPFFAWQDAATIVAALLHQGGRAEGISSDSRQVRSGMLFAAYPGLRQDGRHYIAAALAAGASGVVWEAADFVWPVEFSAVPNVPVMGLKSRLGELAAYVYGDASRGLWMVGVTGTNGKTSCTHWLARAMNGVARKTAVMGTLGNGLPDALQQTGNTTPDAAVVQQTLAAFRQQGVIAVAVEVSSEGLDQGRVDAVQFDVAVLTNLTRDHLDYHGDMASYAAAKARLFDWPGLAYAIVNRDDAFGRELLACPAAGVQRLAYGLGDGMGGELKADVHGHGIRIAGNGLAMQVDTPWGSSEIQAPVLGKFNASNLLAVLGVLLVSGITLTEAAEQIALLHPPAGRMQTLGAGGEPLVVVDYAHTPDALEQVLLTLRALTPGTLWCVLGCGGDRDVGKRPLMGEVASRLADRVVLTADNPRSEQVLDIIADMRAGMTGDETVEPDRRAAIFSVVTQARAGDVVLVAGKGHEDYQEIAGVKYPFRDVSVAQEALACKALEQQS
jgi:UDP-N-acetylmuramoyl-L-alanyl-D-glutamate--2,6-diaminopimelate ligase